jgi:hypothetical protein
MIKAVVFDADGVVITAMTRFDQILENEYGISKEMTLPFLLVLFRIVLLVKQISRLKSLSSCLSGVGRGLSMSF